jgi:hypothetical protein
MQNKDLVHQVLLNHDLLQFVYQHLAPREVLKASQV